MCNNPKLKHKTTGTWSDGSKFWFNDDGKYHRVGGPACVYMGGTRIWYQNGLYHRLDGYAYVDSKCKLFYINGVQYHTKREFKKAAKVFRKQAKFYVDESGNDQWIQDGNYTTFCGDQIYVQDGEYHREDGPAVIFKDGSQFWYKNGVHHREDGPAIVGCGCTKEWYQNGELHRDDGPARIYKDSSEEFWVDGIQYPKKKFKKAVKQFHNKAYMYFDMNNNLQYIMNGKVTDHCNAIIYVQNGAKHRIDGPAVIKKDGIDEYWIEGLKYQNRTFWKVEIERGQ